METLDFFGLGSIKEIEGPERKKIVIQGNVHADHVAFFLNKYDQSDMRESFIYGTGILDGNGLIQVSCKHRHIALLVSEDILRFEDGEFEYNLGQGNILFGTYTGHGTINDGIVQADLTLNISGGYGEYAGASGNIIVTIHQKDPGQLILKLDGAVLITEKDI
jgi:hypothetical protein